MPFTHRQVVPRPWHCPSSSGALGAGVFALGPPASTMGGGAPTTVPLAPTSASQPPARWTPAAATSPSPRRPSLGRAPGEGIGGDGVGGGGSGGGPERRPRWRCPLVVAVIAVSPSGLPQQPQFILVSLPPPSFLTFSCGCDACIGQHLTEKGGPDKRGVSTILGARLSRKDLALMLPLRMRRIDRGEYEEAVGREDSFSCSPQHGPEGGLWQWLPCAQSA